METYGSLDLPPSCNSENAVAFSLLDCEQRMPPWLFAAFVEEHTHFTDLCNIWLTEIHHQEQQQRLDLIKGHSTAVLNSLALQAESVMQVLETQTAAQATLETTLVSVTSLICKALLPYETLRAQLLSIIEVLASFSRSTKREEEAYWIQSSGLVPAPFYSMRSPLGCCSWAFVWGS
ncbi:MAG: uncharacterized protein KVP18_000852 [Porospora cf. gigantea A]|uniref:uncharacterized protein n=1 Tax=Porospora cf. gigantea A TaxID=2853593 RepID=UPI00355AB0DC|nr:MAG: hypothetical protein KVP18_000852 [Porospora cf. gigantea A]